MGLQRGHKKNRNSLPEERGQVPREGMVSIEKSFHAITYSEPIFSYKNDWQWEMGCVVRSKMSFTFLLHWGISDCILPNPREVKWSERSEGMCSILNLLTDLYWPSESWKFVKLSLGKHYRHRRDEVEEKTTLCVIHWLILLITPSNSIMQCNLSPCNSSLLFFWAVSHQCYVLLLQQFGIAFPHSLLNSSSLLNNLEKLTSLLAALKAAKLLFQTSARAWGYFPFLSAFSLLVIFSAAQSSSFSPQACFSFPATQIQSPQPPFWEGKREK